jgi:NADPH:quinone reductase
MRAWVSHSAGGPETLVLEHRAIPQPAPGEVRVRVQAVGVNFPDALLIRDQYQVKPPRPLVPGSEFCGVVDGLGEGESAFVVGDVVIGRCGWGAMAEFITLPQDRCARIPANLPRPEAAALQFTYATAYHALVDVAGLQPGETMLVLGAAGGVGSAAVELGRALGAQVVAAASSVERVAFARALGAAHGVVYPRDPANLDALKALSGRFKAAAPQGVNVVLDPVGGPFSEPALRSLAPGGRHLVVGFTAGIPRLPTNLLLLGSRRLIGVDWRSFVLNAPQANARHVAALLDLWAQGQIRPRVTETFDFEAAPRAIARLESRGATGKLVVTVAG